MNSQLHDHPLQQSFAHIQQLNQYIAARYAVPTSSEWLTPTQLFAPQSAHLAALIHATQQRLHTKSANTIGGALIQEYQWPVISTAIACFLVDRRLPDFDPTQFYLRLPVEEEKETAPEEGEKDHTSIAFNSGRFTALPDDPAADHADAQIVPNYDALRQQLRTTLESHFDWAIKQLSQAVGCNPRGLWLYVSDRCAGTLSWLMQEQDKKSGLRRIEPEFNALLRMPGSPLLNKKVGLFELTYQEHTQVYLDRATCCFWFKSDGGEYCSTCPQRSKEERNELLLKYMAEEYTKVTG